MWYKKHIANNVSISLWIGVDNLVPLQDNSWHCGLIIACINRDLVKDYIAKCQTSSLTFTHIVYLHQRITLVLIFNLLWYLLSHPNLTTKFATNIAMLSWHQPCSICSKDPLFEDISCYFMHFIDRSWRQPRSISRENPFYEDISHLLRIMP